MGKDKNPDLKIQWEMWWDVNKHELLLEEVSGFLSDCGLKVINLNPFKGSMSGRSDVIYVQATIKAPENMSAEELLGMLEKNAGEKLADARPLQGQPFGFKILDSEN